MRMLTLWRVWEASDMAQSDSYFATKAEALAELRAAYDVTPAMLKPDDLDPADCWSANADGSVYLERIRVEPTRAGIAHALKHIPHR